MIRLLESSFQDYIRESDATSGFQEKFFITYSYEDGGANDLPEAIMIRITSMMPDEDILEWLRGAGLEGFSTPEELDVDFFGFMFLIDYSMKDFLTGKADILFFNSAIECISLYYR